MRKIICAPPQLIPQQLEEDIKYFSIYTNPRRKNVGYFGPTLEKDIQRAGIRPSEEVWDFNTIALSVASADNSVPRAKSADGWTRQIDLTIHLCNPALWKTVKKDLEKTLRFLTGDFWHLTFKGIGVIPSGSKKKGKCDCDCVSLLSGGIDSLVGAIDLVASDHKPIFISQIVQGEAETQKDYAKRICPESLHFPWSHKIHLPGDEKEGSTRGRSIIFFAFAALAASAIDIKNDSPVKIYVPENGFISLNIPLNSGRIGSFSTKTTHPVYLKGIMDIWNTVGIKCELIMPYQFKTKGEILTECQNQSLLKELVSRSVSCGKYRVKPYKRRHCGRCLPCLVRRAAFKKWGKTDNTHRGYFAEQFERIAHGNPDDVGAAASACLRVERFGIQKFISGSLSFSNHDDRKKYEGVISRGLKEIEALLNEKDVI